MTINRLSFFLVETINRLSCVCVCFLKKKKKKKKKTREGKRYTLHLVSNMRSEQESRFGILLKVHILNNFTTRLLRKQMEHFSLLFVKLLCPSLESTQQLCIISRY